MTFRTLLGLLVMLTSAVVVAVAQDGTTDSTSEQASRKTARPPLVFRKVFAPADRPEDWPLEPFRYWSMEPDEFDRMLKICQPGSHDKKRSLAAVIVAATYQAQWEDERLLSGQASLKVRHDANRPTMLSLDPCRLAVHDAKWAGVNVEKANLGLGLKNQLNVQVERSGQLEFNWSLRGRTNPFGETQFLIELPRCPNNALILQLPKHLIPSVNLGVVVRGSTKPEGRQTWRLELGGHQRVELRLTAVEDSGQHGSTASVRQSHLYNFSRYGVEVTAELRVDAEGIPLKQIALTCDGGLQLASARYGAWPIQWTTVTPSDQGGITRVVLELPEPIRGPGRVLRLAAVTALREDQPWRLPVFRTEGLFWAEGHATLRIPSPLIVQQLTPIDGRQSRIAPLPGTQPGEVLEVQYFSPKSCVEIELSQRRSASELDCATAVELSGSEVTARVVAQYRLDEGEQFELAAALSRSWIIDEVETIPHDALDDWNVEQGRLVVRLAKALSATRPVSLIITARRLHSPLGKMISPSDLTPLSFDLSGEGRRLMDLRAVPPYRLHVSGESKGTFLDPASLDESVRMLFKDIPQYLIEEEAAMAADLRVSLETQEPTYSAVVQSEVQVVDRSLIESYVIRCHPQAARVDRLRVHFSPARKTPLRWQLGVEEDDTLIPERLPRDDPSTAPNADGETWEIRLRRPQNEPFEIRAQRSTELADGLPISLISLPDAASGHATVLVSQSGSAMIEIENHRLQPIPTKPPLPGRTNAVRATFDYDLTHDLAASPDPAVTIRPLRSPQVSASAWVWHCLVQTRQQADGLTRHLAEYRIETAGRNQIHFTLPRKTRIDDIRGVWVDGERSSWRPLSNTNPPQFAVELPKGRRFPSISIDWDQRRRPLRFLDQLTPELPKPDVPILNRQWTVWLPPGFQATSSRIQSFTAEIGTNDRSETLTKRLLGPLGRSAYSRPFDPTQAEKWVRLVQPNSTTLAAETEALRWSNELGTLIDGQTWAILFTEACQSISESADNATPPPAPIVFFVDRLGLSQMGIDADTLVPDNLTTDLTSAGHTLLQRSGLVLLIHEGAVLVTSATSLALDQAQLQPTEREWIWHIGPGPLAEQIGRATAGYPDRRFVRAKQWGVLPPNTKPPWIASIPNGYRPADTFGWTAQTVPRWGHNDPCVTVVRTAAFRTFRWVAFLSIMGLASWSLRRPASVALLLFLLAIVAIWVPEIWTPVASGGVLGALCCFVYRLMQREPVMLGRVEPECSSPAPERLGTGSQVGLLLLIVGWVGLSTDGVFAQSTPEGPGKKRPKALSVFVPVDDNQKPTGGKYSVPEPLYRELHRQANAALIEPKGWLLRSAIYRGTLARVSNPRRMTVTDFSVRFELEIFGNPKTIRIPLGRDGANLLPDGALLDGQPVQPQWIQNGSLMSIDVPDVVMLDESESIELELLLRPTVKGSAKWNTFELTIPPLATSRLELIVPPDAPAIDVPSSVGRIDDRRTDPSRLIAELGHTETLSVQWKEGSSQGAKSPDIEAEQLTVLRVKPGSVVMDAIWKCRVDEGSIRQLHVAADTRLRMMPLPPDSPVNNVHTNSGPPQSIRFDLTAEETNEIHVKASFLLTGASGIGYLQPPLLELREARVTKRWLAVWIDPALQVPAKPSGLDEVDDIGLPAFEALWGTWDDPSLRPQFACQFRGGRPTWSLALSPREPITHVDQTVLFSFAPKEAQVLLHAELEHQSGYRLQYHVKAPSMLNVDRVSVREQGIEQVARWSRGKGGILILFLNGPTGDKQTLSVRGRIPLSNRNRIPLPDLRVDKVDTLTGRIGIFRRQAVEVKMANPRGLIETETTPAVNVPEDYGRLVKWYDIASDVPARAQVSLVPNRPKVHANQTTRLRFDGEYWEAEVDIRLDVKQGVLDQLRLHVPSIMAGPFSIEPSSWRLSVEEEMEGARRNLILDPPMALKGSSKVIITGPLTLPPSDQVRVPDVTLDDASMSESLLVLPKRTNVRPLVWDTQGLVQCELPNAEPADQETLLVYRIEGRPFEAVLRPMVGTARVLASEVNLRYQAEGACHGLISFDLQAGGLTEVALEMPAGYRPIHVTVAGVTALPIKIDKRRYRLALGPGVLPQRIEVIFSGKMLSTDDTQWRLARPKLSNLPEHETLWTVHSSDSEDLFLEDLDRPTSLAYAMARLRGLGRLLESAGRMTSEGHDQLVTWYTHWVGRWQTARRVVEQALVEMPTESKQSAQTVHDALAQLDAVPKTVANRLGILDVWQRVADTRLPPDVEADLAAFSMGVSQTGYFVSPVGDDSISVGKGSSRSAFPGLAVMATVGFVVLLALTLSAPTRRWMQQWWHRWPQVACILAGLVWWLWMWPSVLGLLLSIGSLVSAFLSPWLKLKARKSASRVVSIDSFSQ